jgi:hypothetical protein
MLCKFCQDINFDEERWDNVNIYPHHADSAALKASADGGCELCHAIFNTPRSSFKSDTCPRITLYYHPDKSATYSLRRDGTSIINKHALELPLTVGIEYGLWGGIGSVKDALEFVELPGEQPSLLPNSKLSLITCLCRLSHGAHEEFYSRKQPAHGQQRESEAGICVAAALLGDSYGLQCLLYGRASVADSCD